MHYQWNNAASSGMVFDSVSERKQVFVGSTVLQHTKQDTFIDTLSVFFSEKQSSRGKCYWPWGGKYPENSSSVPSSQPEVFQDALPFLYRFLSLPAALLLQSTENGVLGLGSAP